MSRELLSPKQVAEKLGINLGTLIKMRSKGARLFDPSFPAMTSGAFKAADISAWVAKNALSETVLSMDPPAPSIEKPTFSKQGTL